MHMGESRSSRANRTIVGRWTVAAALLASIVTVLAACGGGATVGSEPVVRGDATSGVSAVQGPAPAR
jgi:hypothetical protein